MNFIHQFSLIDRNNSGEITKKELTDFMQANNFSDSFVDKWLLIFDFNKRGHITIDDFCERLGLVIDEEMNKHVKKHRPSHINLDDLDDLVKVNEDHIDTNKPLSTPTKSIDNIKSLDISEAYWNYEGVYEKPIEEIIVKKTAYPLFGMPQSKKKKSHKHSSTLPNYPSHSNLGPTSSDNVDNYPTSDEQEFFGENYGKSINRTKSDIPVKSKFDKTKSAKSTENIADKSSKVSVMNKGDNVRKSKKDKHKTLMTNPSNEESVFVHESKKDKSKSSLKSSKRNKTKDVNDKKNKLVEESKDKKSKNLSKSTGNISKSVNKVPIKTDHEDLIDDSQRFMQNPSFDNILWKSRSMPNKMDSIETIRHKSSTLDNPRSNKESTIGSVNFKPKDFRRGRSDDYLELLNSNVENLKRKTNYVSEPKIAEYKRLANAKSTKDLNGTPLIETLVKHDHSSAIQNKIEHYFKNFKFLSLNIRKVKSLPKIENENENFDCLQRHNKSKSYEKLSRNSHKKNEVNIKEFKPNKNHFPSRISSPIKRTKEYEKNNLMKEKVFKDLNNDKPRDNNRNIDNHMKHGIKDDKNKQFKQNTTSDGEKNKNKSLVDTKIISGLPKFQESVNVTRLSEKDYEDHKVNNQERNNKNVKVDNYKNPHLTSQPKYHRSKNDGGKLKGNLINSERAEILDDDIEEVIQSKTIIVENEINPLLDIEQFQDPNGASKPTDRNVQKSNSQQSKKYSNFVESNNQVVQDTDNIDGGSKYLNTRVKYDSSNTLFNDQKSKDPERSDFLPLVVDKLKSDLDLKYPKENEGNVKKITNSNKPNASSAEIAKRIPDERKSDLSIDIVKKTIEPLSVVPINFQDEHFQTNTIEDKYSETNKSIKFLNKEIKILHKDIDEDVLPGLLRSIVSIYEEYASNTNYNCAELIKRFLDKYFELIWHVIINDDDYQLYFTYENMLIFQYDKLTFIIWKSNDSDL